MMAKMRMAKKSRRAMLTRGPIALAIELITTWRPRNYIALDDETLN